MKPSHAVIVALVSFAVIPASAGSADDEPGRQLDVRPSALGSREIEQTLEGLQAEQLGEARRRQEAAAREHWRLYEEWLRASRERETAQSAEDQLAAPAVPDEAESG